MLKCDLRLSVFLNLLTHSVEMTLEKVLQSIVRPGSSFCDCPVHLCFTPAERPATPRYQCDQTNSDISYLIMFLIVTLSCCHSTDLNVRFVVVFIKVYERSVSLFVLDSAHFNANSRDAWPYFYFQHHHLASVLSQL